MPALRQDLQTGATTRSANGGVLAPRSVCTRYLQDGRLREHIARQHADVAASAEGEAAPAVSAATRVVMVPMATPRVECTCAINVKLCQATKHVYAEKVRLRRYKAWFVLPGTRSRPQALLAVGVWCLPSAVRFAGGAR